MSAPFLVRFVDQIVRALEANGEIELVPGRRDALVAEVAGAMGSKGEGHQAVSALSRALLAHPGVEELYVDDEGLMERIGDLGPDWMRG